MPGVVERLKSLRPRLETAFTFNLVDLASQMNEIGFLSDDDYSTVSASKTMFSDREKAHTMVESLIKKVDLNPRNYATFLEMVKKDARKFGSVVEVLSAEESSSTAIPCHPPGGSVQQVPQGYQQKLLSQQQGYPMSSGYGQPPQYMGGPQEIPGYFSNPPVYQGMRNGAGSGGGGGIPVQYQVPHSSGDGLRPSQSAVSGGGGGGIPEQYQVPHSSDGLRPSQSAGMMRPTPGLLFNQGPVPYQSDSISQNESMPKERRAPSEAEGSQSTLDSVDDTTLEAYIQQPLQDEIKKLEREFSKLTCLLLQKLKKENMTVDDLTSIISSLPGDVKLYVYDSWLKIVDQTFKNLDSLFSKLNAEVWTFLDYYLVHYIIDELNVIDLSLKMTEYIDAIQEFKKRTHVMPFIECWKGHPRNIPNYEKVAMKLIDTNITLARLDDLRDGLKQAFFPSLTNCAACIYYDHFDKGCFIVSLLFPNKIVKILKESIRHCNLFDEFNIAYLSIQDEIMYRKSLLPQQSDSGGGGGKPVQYQVPHSSGDGLRPSESAGMMQPTSGSVLFNQGPVVYQSGLSRYIYPIGSVPRVRHAPSEAAGFQSTLDSVDDTTLDEEDLTEVLNEVEEISAKWKVLGTKLGIKGGTKEAIEKDNGTSLECLDEILTAWLRLNYDYQRHGKPSWRKLAEAVRSLNGSLFEKIVKNHGTKVPVVGRREAGATKAAANIGIMKRRKTVPALGRSITMQKLLMIKWQTSAESIHYLRIMEVAATQWKTLGGLLKISPATLESYETQHMKKNEECIRSVFKKWIEATSEEYPTTWYGLIMLLDDADLSSVADALESLAVEHPEAL